MYISVDQKVTFFMTCVFQLLIRFCRSCVFRANF